MLRGDNIEVRGETLYVTVLKQYGGKLSTCAHLWGRLLVYITLWNDQSEPNLVSRFPIAKNMPRHRVIQDVSFRASESHLSLSQDLHSLLRFAIDVAHESELRESVLNVNIKCTRKELTKLHSSLWTCQGLPSERIILSKFEGNARTRKRKATW
jgi:hypothetical protein